MKKTREQTAINAYLKLLRSKGVDDPNILLRESILNDLSLLLVGKVLDGTGYRQVIEQFVEKKPADEWPIILSTAREYFHFWIEDIKSIVEMNRRQAFDKEDASWKPEQITLNELTEKLKTEKFDSSEMWPLKAYKQALKSAGAGQALVDARIKIVKIALIRLRRSPQKNHQTYRTVVDSTLPLFRIKKSRQLFLEVVREFYHFWCGNPEAENFILQAS